MERGREREKGLFLVWGGVEKEEEEKREKEKRSRQA